MINILKNQEIVSYYKTERAYGLGYGVLVKTVYLDGSFKYHFITEALQLSKEYRTIKGFHKYLTERDWVQIQDEYFTKECQKRIL